jgi:hypothetical protein
MDIKGGSISLQANVAQMKAIFTQAKLTETHHIVRFELDQLGAATVLVRYDLHSVTTSGENADGTMTGFSYERDFWVKTGAGWVEKKSKVLSNAYTMQDGRIIYEPGSLTKQNLDP